MTLPTQHELKLRLRRCIDKILTVEKERDGSARRDLELEKEIVYASHIVMRLPRIRRPYDYQYRRMSRLRVYAFSGRCLDELDLQSYDEIRFPQRSVLKLILESDVLFIRERPTVIFFSATSSTPRVLHAVSFTSFLACLADVDAF